MLQLTAAGLTALAAAFVRGLTGFGLAIILVPVLALALSPVDAVLVANFVALFIGLSELRRLAGDAERTAWTIGLWVMLATAPGLMLLAATPPELARLLIALVALGSFLAVLTPVRAATVPGRAMTGVTGVTAGLLTGFAGMPGPPVIPYYVGRAIPRAAARASMLLIFTVAALAGLVSGWAIGVLEWRLAWLAAALFPLVLLGNWLGSLAFGKVSDRLWRSFVGLVLALAALAALWRLLA
nr:sulfite exporter TauE/SafE family protein [Porphyrobacter sp. GA68]